MGVIDGVQPHFPDKMINVTVISHNELKTIRKIYQDKKIVLGSGVFDLFHVGHLEYLQGLRNYGDVVVVLVKSDERVRKNKNPKRPIIPENDRVQIVSSLKFVDVAFVGPYDETREYQIDPTYEEVFDSLQPDVFVTNNQIWKKLEALQNVTIVVNPRTEKGRYNSTTHIIKEIKDNR
jgi:cytidyltransferase-like protein